ncbi:MAG: FeoB-associated Cys-rich membrane protein [Anaeromicrobium sp.]|jgi:hypothetical protein|nr:FeoB-associated Cys-rich membrane protein [Anaeromicrobium sp.]MCT4594273.1 FeoB-associated Cys-rich membrane protein [Anaeromicrobium sp.]
MLSNVIVGIVFGAIVLWAFKRARNDVKNSRCGGCSTCSSKSKCNTKK